jgi:GLPGLI family protein
MINSNDMNMRMVGFIICILLVSAFRGRTQNATFISQGKIEYERRDNLYDQFKDVEWGDGWTDVMKKAIPKFKLTYYDLSFTGDVTFFKPGRENVENDKLPEWLGTQPGEANIIYSNVATKKITSQKNVFGTLFLVEDSTRKIKWKITDETRTIAGFLCRRANAMVMDSIYVVAFYADEIITSGGPESFSGLPGMILGLALPHQHITWFATKVEAVPVSVASLPPPSKGKKVNNATLKESLNDRMKDWGKWGRRNMLFTMI